MKRGRSLLKLNVQGKGVEEFWTYMDKRGGNLSSFKSFVLLWMKLWSGNIFTAISIRHFMSSVFARVSTVFQQTIHLSYIVLTLILEAVIQRCSLKKVFLDISQNPQESTCARVSLLIKFWFAPQRLLFQNSFFFSVELT